jgi:hypothetical protein
VDFDWIQPWNVIASSLIPLVVTGIKKGWFTSLRRGIGDRLRMEQTLQSRNLRISSLEAEVEDLTRSIEARAHRAERVASVIGYDDKLPENPTPFPPLEPAIKLAEQSKTSPTSTG